MCSGGLISPVVHLPTFNSCFQAGGEVRIRKKLCAARTCDDEHAMFACVVRANMGSCCEQGQNTARHRNHSQAGEPRTGISSRPQIQITMEATHQLGEPRTSQVL